MAHDQQTIEQPKRDCRHDEERHCYNAIRMVAKERLPPQRGRAPPPRHILGDAGLADRDAELEKLPMAAGSQSSLSCRPSELRPRHINHLAPALPSNRRSWASLVREPERTRLI